jgi:hypothetical protein
VHTLGDVLDQIRDLETNQTGGDGWPQGYLPKAKLLVPSARTLQLPHHPAGLRVSIESDLYVPEIPGAERETARFTLLSQPSLLIPLPAPTDSMLSELGYSSGGKHEHAHSAYIACAIRTSSDDLCYGQSEIVLIENGVRLGSHALLQHDDLWTTDVDEFVASLGVCMGRATDNLRDGPEGGKADWPRLVALLGGKQSDVSAAWKRHLRLAAGLLQIKLHIVFDADSQFSQVVAGLRTRPPAGLLLWQSQLRDGGAYEDSYKNARPDGVVDYFDPQPGMGQEGVVRDLVLHLKMMVDLEIPAAKAKVSHSEFRDNVKKLNSKHFVLSDRALSHLDANPYHDLQRMLVYVSALESVAQAYHDNLGDVGARLSAYAREQVEIEIALTDSSLTPPPVFVSGKKTALTALPHVKVDDFKKPDRCGRIYFAVDKENLRFVIDHIGLHDYGS